MEFLENFNKIKCYLVIILNCGLKFYLFELGILRFFFGVGLVVRKEVWL